MPVAPDVSVVIPTRNRWHLLPRTLESALCQEGVSVEVIVVDDGSDGRTEAGLRTLSDPRVRHVPAGGRGVSNARNVGIAKARGRWIAFLDDDDLWSPQKLSLQIAAAERDGSVFAYAAAVPVTSDLQVAPGSIPRPPEARNVLRTLILSNAVPAGSSNVVARTDAVRSVEGFDPRLSQIADWDMWLQLAAIGGATALPQTLVAYMQHDENMLLSDASDPFAEFDQLAEKHKALSQSLGVPFSRAHYARWVATRYRRTGERWRAVALLLSTRAGLRAGPLGNPGRAALLAIGEPAFALARRARPGGTPRRPSWLDHYA